MNDIFNSPAVSAVVELALREDTYHNPMRDRAGDFANLPYSFEDLELDGRPDVPSKDIHGVGPTEDPVEGDESRRARLPDIGADEATDPDSDTDLAWYYAEISPNPVGRITTAGGLYVDVRVRGLRNLGAATRFDGGVDNDISPPPGHRMFILPQGALQAAFDAGGRVSPENNPDWVSDWLIPRAIPITYVNVGGGRYIGTNAEPIGTIVWENLAAKSPLQQGIPTQGDVLADGHAALFIYVPEELKRGDHELLGYTQNYHSQFPSPMSDASDALQIVDQAVWGRHFIIDTVPPRLSIDLVNPPRIAEYIYRFNRLCARCDFFFNFCRVDIHRYRVYINKNRRSAYLKNTVNRCNKCKRRCYYLVACPDTQSLHT